MTQVEGEWTVRRILEWTAPFLTRKGVDSPRLSAEMLLASVLAVPRIKLYTSYDQPLAPAALANYRELVRRAAEHEPVAYITGHAPFFNLDFLVTRDVLIPRPDSETLVEAALTIIRRQAGMESPRILDLCTGSGCVAAALGANCKTATVVAVDSQDAAAKIAMENIERLKLSDRVVVLVGDLYQPLADEVDKRPFNLIVANPPYIPTGQIVALDKSVKDFEPRTALDGGPDGLAIHRRIIEGAAAGLSSGGHLLVEIAFDQGQRAMEIAAGCSDLSLPRIIKDHAGHERVLALSKP
jgi:release factor glutamine methyltransferase